MAWQALRHRGRLSRHGRNTIAYTLLALVVAGACAWVFPRAFAPIERNFFDLSLAANAYLNPDDDRPRAVTIIGVDQATLNSPIFEMDRLPRIMFAPAWSAITQDLIDAGVTAVGHDAIFAYSMNRLQPNYDRPFLATLAKNRDQVVIGRSLSVLPERPYRAAIRSPERIGLLELPADPDDIVRAIPRSGDPSAPYFAEALVSLVGAAEDAHPDRPRYFAPRTSPGDIRAVSMASVLSCAREDPEALRAALEGQVVIIGTMMGAEDLHRHGMKYFPASDAAPVEACLNEIPPDRKGYVNGVRLHAAAVDSLLSGQVVQPANGWWSFLLTLGLAGTAALFGMLMGFGVSFVIWCVAAGVALIVGVVAVTQGYRIDVATPVVWALLAGIGAYALRFVTLVRVRERMSSAFGKYLSPAIVSDYVEERMPLEPGTQEMQIAILFADLTGFTAFTERNSPNAVVEEVNRYLAFVVDEVEASGGYVDKFLGDGLMAFWGAPLPATDNEPRMVGAILAAAQAIKNYNAGLGPDGRQALGVRFGMTAGTALVGNVGTGSRLGYTAIGKEVNLAARLEAVSSRYGVVGLMSETVMAAVADDLLVRQIDTVRVKGIERPQKVYEPRGPLSAASDDERYLCEVYERGLRCYEARDFEGALAAWESLSDIDPASATMAKRAQKLMVDQVGPSWDAVWKYG